MRLKFVWLPPMLHQLHPSELPWMQLALGVLSVHERSPLLQVYPFKSDQMEVRFIDSSTDVPQFGWARQPTG